MFYFTVIVFYEFKIRKKDKIEELDKGSRSVWVLITLLICSVFVISGKQRPRGMKHLAQFEATFTESVSSRENTHYITNDERI